MSAYLRLLRFLKPYRGRFLGAIACMVVLSLTTAAYANLIGPVLEFLFTGRVESAKVLARFFPSSVDFTGWLAVVDRSSMLAMVPVAMIVLATVKGLAYFGQFYLMGMVGQRVVADVRRALFDSLLRLSPEFYVRRHTGDLLSRFSADVGSVEAAVTNAVATYIRDGMMVVVMLGNCFYLNWRFSLIVFGAVPVTLYPIIRLAKRLKRVTVQSRAELGTIASIAQEAVTGIRVVQSYGMEAWESGRLDQANHRWLRVMRRSYLVRAFSSPLMEIMAALGLGLAIWWVGGQILAGRLAAADFLSFVAAVLFVYTPVKQLGRVGQIAMQGAAGADRVFEILDAESPVKDAGTKVLAPFHESVRYERVEFAYDEGRPILRALEIQVGKGEVVALVGASGGGKTTVANLLPRFWDVSGGRITVDGVDIRDVTLASLRAQLSIVSQETLLFADTVRANIAYGRPDVLPAEVERAARLAQAHEFISALENGYDTVVGEKGVMLSGGQRQRIAIARAFLRDAPILILDEATSALDAESEREVQKALDGLMGLEDDRHRTTLVIAHRLSTIRHADRIYVLGGGRVVEQGRHEELLERGGEYARLYRIFEGEKSEEARASVA